MPHKIHVLETHVIPIDRFNHEESSNCLCCPYVDEYFMNAIIHNKIGKKTNHRKIQPNGIVDLSRNRLFGNSKNVTIQEILDSNVTW